MNKIIILILSFSLIMPALGFSENSYERSYLALSQKKILKLKQEKIMKKYNKKKIKKILLFTALTALTITLGIFGVKKIKEKNKKKGQQYSTGIGFGINIKSTEG